MVIEGVKGAVQKGVIPQDLGNSYIGEALFFRAMSHLELLKFYARPYNFTAGATHPGVPYRTKGIYSLETIDEGLNQEEVQLQRTISKFLMILIQLNLTCIQKRRELVKKKCQELQKRQQSLLKREFI